MVLLLLRYNPHLPSKTWSRGTLQTQLCAATASAVAVVVTVPATMGITSPLPQLLYGCDPSPVCTSDPRGIDNTLVLGTGVLIYWWYQCQSARAVRTDLRRVIERFSVKPLKAVIWSSSTSITTKVQSDRGPIMNSYFLKYYWVSIPWETLVSACTLLSLEPISVASCVRVADPHILAAQNSWELRLGDLLKVSNGASLPSRGSVKTVLLRKEKDGWEWRSFLMD